MKTQLLTKQKEPSFWSQQVGTIKNNGKSGVERVREARRKLELEERYD